MKASINSIESFGLVDGPGIRTVVFFNGCKLRCKYCHNPEMWTRLEDNYTSEELVKKIIRNKPYFKRNNGGVTFSGGEPLLHADFLIEVCKMLKDEGVHIALDTAGQGLGNYEEVLKNIDLVIFDVKAVDPTEYKELVGREIDESLRFLEVCQNLNKPMWLRQVVVPGINDTEEHMIKLREFIKPLKNIEKVELLPYHTMGVAKYEKLGIPYVLAGVKPLSQERCNELYKILKNED